MDGSPWLIFAALDFEARALAGVLGLRFTSRTVAAGEPVAGLPVRLHTIGPGGGHLPAPSDPRPAGVILAGLGGGLSPAVARGAVVLDEESRSDMATPLPRVKFCCSPRIVSTPDEKASLFGRTGAAVVDMESCAVKSWARQHGVAYVGVRGVSDAAGDALHPSLARIVDDSGRLRPFRLFSEVVRHPSFARTVWSLRDSTRVMRDVAGAVRALLAAATASRS